MKKLILIFAAASMFAACGNKQEKTLGTESVPQTVTPPAPVVVQKEVHYIDRTPAQPVQQEKKGWSKGAKGAVIGGVGGAVVGAAVSDKKGKGAIIGGAVGAGAGYLIGRDQDKKDGRVK
jgi:hypothetical protein